MTATIVSDVIGRGVQLFRIRDPQKHLSEFGELSPLTELFVARRRAWKAKEEEAWYALLTIPLKDEEEILVRAPSASWEEWEWKDLIFRADAYRWRGYESRSTLCHLKSRSPTNSRNSPRP